VGERGSARTNQRLIEHGSLNCVFSRSVNRRFQGSEDPRASTGLDCREQVTGCLARNWSARLSVSDFQIRCAVAFYPKECGGLAKALPELGTRSDLRLIKSRGAYRANSGNSSALIPQRQAFFPCFRYGKAYNSGNLCAS